MRIENPVVTGQNTDWNKLMGINKQKPNAFQDSDRAHSTCSLIPSVLSLPTQKQHLVLSWLKTDINHTIVLPPHMYMLICGLYMYIIQNSHSLGTFHPVTRTRTFQKTICLTEHSQTEFLFALPGLVLGDARVLSFVQLGYVHYSHFGAIFIEAVLLLVSEFYSVPVDNAQSVKTLTPVNPNTTLLTSLRCSVESV